jgi:hypothetical protein
MYMTIKSRDIKCFFFFYNFHPEILF